MKNKLVCRFALNPSFVDRVATLDLTELDPDKIHRNKKYDRNLFRIEVHFRPVCEKCKPNYSCEQLCNECSIKMRDTDIPFWKIIESVLDSHRYPTYTQGCLINFNSNTCDYADTLREAKAKLEEENGNLFS